MKFLPDPLHPAIVHFPIVLILLGTVVGLVAVFWRKPQFPILAGILLTLGAIGAWVAVETGKSDGGLVETRSPQAESLLEAHENWAKRTAALATMAAVAALVSLPLLRSRRLGRVAAALTALVAIAASYAVCQTGHRGGALVYHHAAGVILVETAAPSTGEAKPVERD